ncbi:unnamed protein product [Musa textilis]
MNARLGFFEDSCLTLETLTWILGRLPDAERFGLRSCSLGSSLILLLVVMQRVESFDICVSLGR